MALHWLQIKKDMADSMSEVCVMREQNLGLDRDNPNNATAKMKQ